MLHAQRWDCTCTSTGDLLLHCMLYALRGTRRQPILTNKSLEILSSPLSCTLCTEHSYFFNKMLHTLWTCSLFCLWGWIVQEEPLPALLQPGHCWSHQGRARGLGLCCCSPRWYKMHQLRLESSWVCVWAVKPLGAQRTHSHTEVCRLLNTHRLLPPQDFSLAGGVVIPCQGQVWTDIPGNWKEGGDWHISVLWVLAGCCASSALVVTPMCFTEHSMTSFSERCKSEKLSRLLSWIT